MHLGIALPYGDIGGDGPIVREFAQLAEAEGYEGLTLADHVLGGNPADPASGRAGGLGLFHDPFVAFGFIAACTKKVELSTQVLILAQRQMCIRDRRELFRRCLVSELDQRTPPGWRRSVPMPWYPSRKSID